MIGATNCKFRYETGRDLQYIVFSDYSTGINNDKALL